jgi:Alw26I/Eco31I/Esp3I family type II restriction m6 adenine DNA methyltransferase
MNQVTTGEQLVLTTDKFSRSDTEKTLLVRTTGRFYTPALIGQQLLSPLAQEIRKAGFLEISVIDPFCGDGRLICWLMEMVAAQAPDIARTWLVSLWDCDSLAVKTAQKQVLEAALRVGHQVKLTAKVGNAFEMALAQTGEFMFCVTNPPWEVLKPDTREVAGLTEEEVAEHTLALRGQDKFLTGAYPRSTPKRKFSGWGVNLARCGTEVAFKLTAAGGWCGVVSPASLLADQVSGTLRQWIFEESSITDLAYFPAEARLFEGVDQPSITLIARRGTPTTMSPKLSQYDKRGQWSAIEISSSGWDSIKRNAYIFPLQFGLGLLGIKAKWAHLPAFGEQEGTDPASLWAGRELDETRHEQYLSAQGKYLFVKGRMLKRFGMAETPSRFVKEDGPRIPQSADFYRLAWRDVARPTQKRRIHATILAPGHVTGNSISIAYYRDGSQTRIKALLGIVNSLVFEAQARMHLATAHVSLGAVRLVHIPALTNPIIIEELADLVDTCSNAGLESLPRLEARVAQLYNLTRDDFATLISSFEKITIGERDALLDKSLWLAPENE